MLVSARRCHPLTAQLLCYAVKGMTMSLISNTSNKLVLLVSLLLICGCSVSQYHLGYHHMGDNKTMYSVVSGGVDEMTSPLEKAIIGNLTTYELTQLRQYFAPKIASSVTDANLNDTAEKLKNTYALTGKSERIKVVGQYFMLDEGNMKKPFEFYDFVGADYILYGKTTAVARLYMTQIDGAVKLCGFVIMDEKPNDNGNNPSIKYLFPESIDKGKMAGRRYKIIK